MGLPFSPEFRLLAACAMWPNSELRTEAIRDAAQRQINWFQVVALARRHQVTGLFNDGLSHAESYVPKEVAKRVGVLAATEVRENLAIARETVRLQRIFDDAGVPTLFLKGTTLAVLAFKNIGLRSGQDVDLFVSNENLPTALEIVRRAGYGRFAPPPSVADGQFTLLKKLRKDIGFLHQQNGTHLELHWRLFLNPHAMAQTELLARSRLVPVTDTKAVRTLGEEDLFAYLCMHGALHWWYRLKWLADINALVTAPRVDMERMYGGADERGVQRAAAQGLLLCRTVLGTELPKDLSRKVLKSFAIRWLEGTALKALTWEAEPQERRFGTTRGSMSTFILNGRWQYQVAELKGLFANQSDILTVPLPKPLWFLYPLLRLPLWVWRHLRPR
jgi:hypothetical protein